MDKRKLLDEEGQELSGSYRKFNGSGLSPLSCFFLVFVSFLSSPLLSFFFLIFFWRDEVVKREISSFSLFFPSWLCAFFFEGRVLSPFPLTFRGGFVWASECVTSHFLVCSAGIVWACLFLWRGECVFSLSSFLSPPFPLS